jgi:hypothetical protein
MANIDLGTHRRSARLATVHQRTPPTSGNGYSLLGDERASEDFPLPIRLFLHAIERYHKLAVRADQQHRLRQLAGDHVEIGKSPHASGAVDGLVERLHGRQEILWGVESRLNLWTGEGKGARGIIAAKGFELALDDRANRRAVSGRELPLVHTGDEGQEPRHESEQ